MIGKRQKQYLLNTTLQKYLQKGTVPSLQTLLNAISKKLSGKVWGLPTARLRPAVRGTKIGGMSGNNIQETYEELKDDVMLLYAEAIDVAERTLTNYQIFYSRKLFLRKRLEKLMQGMTNLLNFFSKGSRYIFYDTFTDTDNIELSETNAELAIEEGAVTLPQSRSLLSPYDMSNTTISAEIVPDNSIQHSSFSNTFDDYQNTAWHAELGGGTYIVTLKTATTPQKANGFYIDPATPITVVIEWSNDGYNFYPLISDTLNVPKTWTFDQINANYFRLAITGYDVGIKKLRPMVVHFKNEGTLVTTSLQATDPNTSQITLRSAELSMETFLPYGTDIQAYITTDQYDTLMDWKRIDKVPVTLATVHTYNIDLNEEHFTTEDVATSIPVYSSVIDEGNLLTGTETLVKGSRQFTIDYFNYDWNSEDDPAHIPLKEDWAGKTNYKRGYFTPIISTAASAAINEPNTLYAAQNPLCEVAEQTTGTAEWFVVGLLDGGGNTMFMSGGNYRITTYVYTPTDLLLNNQPCLVYNPDSFGGSGSPIIAPFHVYLNDKSLLYATTSFTDLQNVGVYNYMATYSFKQGWNKLEIYMYFPGIGADGVDQTGLAASGVGLYFKPNIIGFNQTTYKVQATPSYQKRISEFMLKYRTPPGSKDYWAWADRPNPNSPWKLLLNFDPSQAAEVLDGILQPMIPALTLNYDREGDTTIDAVRLKFVLSKNTDTDATPRLLGYTLRLT